MWNGYDNRDRLTAMDRGVLDGGGQVPNPLIHGKLAGKQQWSDLDHRGNWLNYRESFSFSGGQAPSGDGQGITLLRVQYGCFEPARPFPPTNFKIANK